jgi:hypothetical protein
MDQLPYPLAEEKFRVIHEPLPAEMDSNEAENMMEYQGTLMSLSMETENTS